MFLSLVIPSFLSIFKISFDEYVAAEEANVKGVNTQKGLVNRRDNKGNTNQNVSIDIKLPKIGAIQNLSQKPFTFPKPQKTPTSFPSQQVGPLNDQIPVIYDLTDDDGRGSSYGYEW